MRYGPIRITKTSAPPAEVSTVSLSSSNLKLAAAPCAGDGRTFGLHDGAVRRRLIRLVRHAGAHEIAFIFIPLDKEGEVASVAVRAVCVAATEAVAALSVPGVHAQSGVAGFIVVLDAEARHPEIIGAPELLSHA